jgi:hypothetical protein
VGDGVPEARPWLRSKERTTLLTETTGPPKWALRREAQARELGDELAATRDTGTRLDKKKRGLQTSAVRMYGAFQLRFGADETRLAAAGSACIVDAMLRRKRGESHT